MRADVASACLGCGSGTRPGALVCGQRIRPYLWVLTVWPVSRDATIWISRGATVLLPVGKIGLLRTNHFNVGYRPVTALSYTADYLIGGFAAWPYRLTDLGLHLLSAVLVYLTYRRLAPKLAPWGGVLAAGLFAMHPVVDQVVPQLARRSYSLATVFGLGGLLVLCPRTEPGPTPWARSLAGGTLLTLAVLSHEAAYMTVPIALLVVLHRALGRPDPFRRVVALGTIPLLLVLGALWVRAGVVDGVGGYADKGARVERVVPIALATWHTLDAAAPLNEDSARGFPMIVRYGSLLLGLYYVGLSAAGLFRGLRDDHARLVAILLAWVLGLIVLYSLLGVWFPRQVYVALAPFALLVAVLLASSVAGASGKRWPSKLHLVPQLLLVGWISIHSPAILGADPLRAASWRKTDAMACGGIQDQIEEGTTSNQEGDPFEGLGGPELGIDASLWQLPCADLEHEFVLAMRPHRQQVITSLAVRAFFDSLFAPAPTDRETAAAYLERTLPSELSDAVYTRAE